MSQSGILKHGGGGNGANDFITDNGTAVPSSGVLNVIGGTGITTSASSNTVVITNEMAKPNAYIFLSDDFIGIANQPNILSSQLGWYASNFISLTSNANSGHYGIISSDSMVGGDSWLFLNNFNTAITPQLILGSGAVTINWIIKIGTLSTGTNTYTLRIGLGDTKNADEANGLYFEYTNGVNSGNWQYKSASASTRTTSNSSVAADTNWHNFQITINAAATSVSYSIDGVSLGTAITTNIPTAAITPFIDIVRSAGTIPQSSVNIDLFYMSQILTTAR